MFTEFLFALRSAGLLVSPTEWLDLMRALATGQVRADLASFYHLARALLVKRETEYDLYDQVFAVHFRGLEAHFEIDDELLAWLENPVGLPDLDPEQLAALEGLDLEELREKFRERLEEQDERHDGGNRWIGTGGTSPFGHGGVHPTGIRIGGAGGGRSAVQVASDRLFRNLRTDRVLDTRQIGVALTQLRRLGRDEGPEELDVDRTVERSAKEGEIELIFGPPRRNQVKLLLLLDVGGSMDPHAELCERLFSAAHAASHFRHFESRFFHNCVYERLFTDIFHRHGEPTSEVLKRIDDTWSVLFVGDAWMSPFELTHAGGSVDWFHHNRDPGLAWLRRFRERCPRSAWLNPVPPRIWAAPSIRLIRDVFPMFELTLDGLHDAVDFLSGRRGDVGAARAG